MRCLRGTIHEMFERHKAGELWGWAVSPADRREAVGGQRQH